MCGLSSGNTRAGSSHSGQSSLWHTWDRLKEVVLLSKRVSLAIKALRTWAVERGILTNVAEMGIDGDWERGRVWFKRLRTEGYSPQLWSQTWRKRWTHLKSMLGDSVRAMRVQQETVEVSRDGKGGIGGRGGKGMFSFGSLPGDGSDWNCDATSSALSILEDMPVTCARTLPALPRLILPNRFAEFESWTELEDDGVLSDVGLTALGTARWNQRVKAANNEKR